MLVRQLISGGELNAVRSRVPHNPIFEDSARFSSVTPDPDVISKFMVAGKPVVSSPSMFHNYAGVFVARDAADF